MTETGRAGERRGHALIEDITYAGPEDPPSRPT